MKYTAFVFIGVALLLGAMMADFSSNTQEIYGENTTVEELYTPKDFWENITGWFSGDKKLSDISYDDFTPEEQEVIKSFTGGRPIDEFTESFCKIYGTAEYYEMKISIQDSNPEKDYSALFLFFEQISAFCD